MYRKNKIRSGTKHIKISMEIDNIKYLMKGASNKSYQKSSEKKSNLQIRIMWIMMTYLLQSPAWICEDR